MDSTYFLRCPRCRVGTLIRDYDQPAPWPKQRMVCLACSHRLAITPVRETLLDNLDVVLARGPETP